MDSFKIKYSTLSEHLIKGECLKDVIKDNFDLNEKQFNIIAKQKIARFISSHDLKFKKQCHFKRELFVSKNRDWLERELVFDSEVFVESQSTADLDSVNDTGNGADVGETEPALEVSNVETVDEINHSRAKKRRIVPSEYRSRKRRRIIKTVKKGTTSKVLKPFNECSTRTKRRRCVKLSSALGKEQVSVMYRSYLRSIGMKDEAKIVERLRSASPNRKAKILAMLSVDIEIQPYTSDEALALFVDTKLSTHQYHIIQQQAKARNANIYPPYYKIAESKKMCYPKEESIIVTETGANIKLQSLLDHTSARYFSFQSLSLIYVPDEMNRNLFIRYHCDSRTVCLFYLSYTALPRMPLTKFCFWTDWYSRLTSQNIWTPRTWKYATSGALMEHLGKADINKCSARLSLLTSLL